MIQFLPGEIDLRALERARLTDAEAGDDVLLDLMPADLPGVVHVWVRRADLAAVLWPETQS